MACAAHWRQCSVRQETANSVKISVCPLGVRTAFQLGVVISNSSSVAASRSTLTTLIELFDRNWQKHFSTKEVFQYDRLHSANDPEFKILDKRYYLVPFDVLQTIIDPIVVFALFAGIISLSCL